MPSSSRSFPFCKALVTGAAGDLGRALCHQLAQAGVELVLLDRDKSSQQTLADSLPGPVKVHTYQADLTDLENYQQLLEELVRHHPDLDLVIANAGIDVPQRLESMDWRLVERHYQIHTLSNHVLMQVVAPFFVAKNKGHIAVTISMAALSGGFPFETAYSGSKAAMAITVDGWRCELASTGVTLTGIYPGFLEGKLAADNAWDSSSTTSPAYAARKIIQAIAQRKKRLVFPAILYWKAKLFRSLPLFIQDRMVKKLMQKNFQS